MRPPILIGLVTMCILSSQAFAVQPRCGHDAFGNIVCMDRDGVLSSKPAKSNRQERSSAPKSGVSETVEENGSRESGNEADTPAVRCGTDPFGNTVCR